MRDSVYEQVFNYALKILERRARSISQLREKLLARPPANVEVVEKVIARLKELGYLNDQDFVYNFASNKLNTKTIGRARMRRVLATKKVPAEAANNALDRAYQEVDEES